MFISFMEVFCNLAKVALNLLFLTQVKLILFRVLVCICIIFSVLCFPLPHIALTPRKLLTGIFISQLNEAKPLDRKQ